MPCLISDIQLSGSLVPVIGKAVTAKPNFLPLFSSENGGVFREIDSPTRIAITGTFRPDGYYHCVLTYSGSGTNVMTLYVNGAQTGTSSAGTAITVDSSAQLEYGTNFAQDFAGWTIVLTPTEAQNLFLAAGRP